MPLVRRWTETLSGRNLAKRVPGFGTPRAEQRRRCQRSCRLLCGTFGHSGESEGALSSALRRGPWSHGSRYAGFSLAPPCCERLGDTWTDQRCSRYHSLGCGRGSSAHWHLDECAQVACPRLVSRGLACFSSGRAIRRSFTQYCTIAGRQAAAGECYGTPDSSLPGVICFSAHGRAVAFLAASSCRPHYSEDS